jgi:gas vesicle protein
MLQHEKFGDNFATVANLGSRKARAIAYFTKEEIEEYAKGGDLRNIPHDDVSSMLATELEGEVRRLREKEKRLKDSHQKEVEKLKEIIDDLKIRAEDPMQLTPPQKAERQLRALTGEYSIALSKIAGGFREAMSILDEGEKIPGIGVQELNAWLNEFVPDSVTIHDLLDQWQAGFENPGPIVDNFFDIISGKTGV